MGRFEDGATASTLDAAHGIYLPRERRQRAGAGQGRQRRGPAASSSATTASTFDDIDVFYLAGGFGRHLNVDAARRIGLIPNLPDDRSFRWATRRSRARASRSSRARSAAELEATRQARRALPARDASGVLRFLRRRLPVSCRYEFAVWRHGRSRTPDAQVDDREYITAARFSPRPRLEGRALELAQWARTWYAAHGRPWVYARQSSSSTIGHAVDRRRRRVASPATVFGACSCRRMRTASCSSPSARARRSSARPSALARRAAGRVLLPRDVRLRGRRAPDRR